MNFTNKHKIPEHVCKWLALDEYDYNPDVISATTLIAPARMWALKRKHAAELAMDYSDMLALRYGTAIHDSLEKAAAYGENIIEERFYATKDGFSISGKMDGIIDGVIRDNKSTSVWKFVHQDYGDYIKQLSIYKWLLKKNGIETAAYGFIDFFFTDWKKSDAAKGRNYPPIRYQEVKLALWSVEEAEAYIGGRLDEFVFAEEVLPDCSPEELWQTETTYAYYAKVGGTKATKVYQSEAEAQEAVKAGGEVKIRKGMAKRCAYCTAAPFCEQFNKLRTEGFVDAE